VKEAHKVIREKHWSAEAVEELLVMQGLRPPPGRAARIADGLNASARQRDPLLGTLEFETDATAYALALRRCGGA
jgi:hypothetical protein